MATPSPWSIKGIDAEARRVAKAAAQREGVTLGVWLTQQIHERGAAGQGQGQGQGPGQGKPAASASAPAQGAGKDIAAAAQAASAARGLEVERLDSLAKQLEAVVGAVGRATADAAESLTARVSEQLTEQVTEHVTAAVAKDMAGRLAAASEQAQAASAALTPEAISALAADAATAAVAPVLAQLEARGSAAPAAGPSDQALDALSAKIDKAAHRQETHAATLTNTVAAIGQRVASVEARLTEAQSQSQSQAEPEAPALSAEGTATPRAADQGGAGAGGAEWAGAERRRAETPDEWFDDPQNPTRREEDLLAIRAKLRAGVMGGAAIGSHTDERAPAERSAAEHRETPPPQNTIAAAPSAGADQTAADQLRAARTKIAKTKISTTKPPRGEAEPPVIGAIPATALTDGAAALALDAPASEHALDEAFLRVETATQSPGDAANTPDGLSAERPPLRAGQDDDPAMPDCADPTEELRRLADRLLRQARDEPAEDGAVAPLTASSAASQAASQAASLAASSAPSRSLVGPACQDTAGPDGSLTADGITPTGNPAQSVTGPTEIAANAPIFKSRDEVANGIGGGRSPVSALDEDDADAQHDMWADYDNAPKKPRNSIAALLIIGASALMASFAVVYTMQTMP